MKNKDFLDNLKNAVENGDFNSDAAKKISEINKLVDEKKANYTPDELEKRINDKIENNKAVELDGEKILEINNEYEKKMEYFKNINKRNKTIAELVELNKKLNEINSRINEITEEYSDDNGIQDILIKIKNGDFNDEVINDD